MIFLLRLRRLEVKKLEAIENILDGIQKSGYATQVLLSIRKKFLLSGVSSEYKDLVKFVEDIGSHLFAEELEDSLKSGKEGVAVFRHSNLKQTICMLQLSENSMKFQKTGGQPKDRWLSTRAPHSSTTQIHGQN